MSGDDLDPVRRLHAGDEHESLRAILRRSRLLGDMLGLERGRVVLGVLGQLDGVLAGDLLHIVGDGRDETLSHHLVVSFLRTSDIRQLEVSQGTRSHRFIGGLVGFSLGAVADLGWNR